MNLLIWFCLIQLLVMSCLNCLWCEILSNKRCAFYSCFVYFFSRLFEQETEFGFEKDWSFEMSFEES
jgi:hypothetical protein